MITQMLEKRLQVESPIKVLKSFNNKVTSATTFYEVLIPAIQHKKLNDQPKAFDI